VTARCFLVFPCAANGLLGSSLLDFRVPPAFGPGDPSPQALSRDTAGAKRRLQCLAAPQEERIDPPSRRKTAPPPVWACSVSRIAAWHCAIKSVRSAGSSSLSNGSGTRAQPSPGSRNREECGIAPAEFGVECRRARLTQTLQDTAVLVHSVQVRKTPNKISRATDLPKLD